MRLEDFEKYLQKRLKDHKDYDLDPSSIWTNVESEITTSEKRPFYSWWTLFAGLFFFILSFLLLFNRASTSIPFSQKTTAPEEIQSNLISPYKDANLSDTVVLNSSAPSANKDLSKEPESIIKNKVPTLQSLKTKTLKVSSDKLKQQPIFQDEPFTFTNTISPLHTLELGLLTSKTIAIDSILNPVIPPKQKRSKKLTLLAEFGPNYTLSGLPSQQNPAYTQLRKNTESPLLGWQTSISIFYPVLKKWAIGTGINYSKTNFKLYVEQDRTDQIILPNMPLNILIDSQTLDTVGVHFGNAVLDSMTYQKVQHYNELKEFSIPIYLGLFDSRKSFKFGFLAGISYRFNLQQAGKVLNKEAQVINIKEQAYFNKSGFSFLLKPVLMYSFGENTAISISPSFQLDISNKVRDEYFIIQKPLQFNLSLGIQKRLNF